MAKWILYLICKVRNMVHASMWTFWAMQALFCTLLDAMFVYYSGHGNALSVQPPVSPPCGQSLSSPQLQKCSRWVRSPETRLGQASAYLREPCLGPNSSSVFSQSLWPLLLFLQKEETFLNNVKSKQTWNLSNAAVNKRWTRELQHGIFVLNLNVSAEQQTVHLVVFQLQTTSSKTSEIY